MGVQFLVSANQIPKSSTDQLLNTDRSSWRLADAGEILASGTSEHWSRGWLL